MPAINEKELRAAAKAGELGGAYLIYGEDTYRKEAAVRLLQGAVTQGGFGGFGNQSFEGKDAQLDDIAEAIETVPLTGGGVCVVVRDLPFDSLSDGQLKKLKALTGLVPPQSVLIFWQTGEMKRTSRVRSIIRLFEEKGFVLECAKMSSAELERLLSMGAKKRGCLLSPSAAAYLVQSVGNDLNLLLHELEKLCAYASKNPAGEGSLPEITTKTVDELCAKTLEATAFDMSRALLAGNMSAALSYLDMLFSQRAEPIMILGALNSAFIDLYRARLAQLNSRGMGEIAQLFPNTYKGKEFRLRNAGQRAANLPLSRLRVCLRYLQEADILLKTSATPPRPLLERTLMSLALALRVKRRA
ncbi:MAG: DNA polymerase III subunit delta [Clostridium sp.]|jgi:DNA polymerase-3 subunit delta|nr:DNA polymerase III subunit delta [Clostridium sp.]